MTDSDVRKRLTKKGLPLDFRYSFSTPTFQAKPDFSCDSYGLAASPVGAVLEIKWSKDCLQKDSAILLDLASKQVTGFDPDFGIQARFGFRLRPIPSLNVSVHQRNSCIARKSQMTPVLSSAFILKVALSASVLHDRNCTRSDVGMSCSTLSHTSFH